VTPAMSGQPMAASSQVRLPALVSDEVASMCLGTASFSRDVGPSRMVCSSSMSPAYCAWLNGRSALMSSGSSGSMSQCRCDSEFDPSSTARRPVRSIARRVAAPSVSISVREASE